MIPVGSLHCSASDPAPCRWPVKTAEDGLSTWTSLPTWETQVRLLALAHPRSSRCSHLGSEPVDGRLNLFSLCLYFSLFISLSNKLREKKETPFVAHAQKYWAVTLPRFSGRTELCRHAQAYLVLCLSVYAAAGTEGAWGNGNDASASGHHVRPFWPFPSLCY